jgi:hypothetical protein
MSTDFSSISDVRLQANVSCGPVIDICIQSHDNANRRNFESFLFVKALCKMKECICETALQITAGLSCAIQTPTDESTAYCLYCHSLIYYVH